MKNFCKKIAIFLSVIALFQIFPVNAMVSITPNSKNVTSSTTTTNHSEIESIPAMHGPEERLLKDEFGLNSFVFKAPDGTRTLQYFDHPVKYIDDTGNINDISLSVKPDLNNGYTAVSHFAEISFPEKIKNGITASFMDTSITMIPITNNNASAFSTDEKIISYFSDKNTVYNYSVTYSGFKEDIVVNEFTGQTEYSFILKTGGLSLIQRNGSYSLTDNVGNVKAFVDEIIIFTADNRNNTYGNLIAETVTENDEYLMTILIDPEFLSDEKTVYPITIDPSVSFNYTGDIDDITINSSDEDPNGSSGSIHCGYRSTYGKSRILMKFPNLSFSSIPSASSIVSATVEIRDLMCQSESLDIGCYRFTGNVWSESTATWNTVNANSYATPQLSHNVISYSNGLNQPSSHRYSFDITSAVRLWYSSTTDKNKGIIFKSNSESTLRHKTFASYDRASNKPTLTIVYNEQEQVDISNTVLESSEIFMYPNEVKRIRILNMPSTCTAYFLPINSNPDFYLENRNDGTCDITALNLGYISISVNVYIPNRGLFMIGTCTVNSIIFGSFYDSAEPYSLFYLKNINDNKFVDVEHTDSTVSQSGRTYTWNFDIHTPKIKVSYIGQGCYTITNNSSYLALSMDQEDPEVIFTSAYGNSYDEAKWLFYISEHGNYMITPYLHPTLALISSTNNTTQISNKKLQLGVFTNDLDCCDEWDLPSAKTRDYTNFFRGYDENDPRAITLINNVALSASLAEKSGVSIRKADISDIRYYGATSKVYAFTTHGFFDRILIDNNTSFMITDWDKLNPTGLDNVDLVLLGACYTGLENVIYYPSDDYTYPNGDIPDTSFFIDISFAHKTKNIGAKYVIAFENSISVDITDWWISLFFEEYYRPIDPDTGHPYERSLVEAINASIIFADNNIQTLYSNLDEDAIEAYDYLFEQFTSCRVIY